MTDPTPAVTIRRAVQDDLETLRLNEPRPELKLADKRFAEQQAGTGIFAVALLDGQLIASGFLDFADEELVPEVKNLWVYPAARRHGAGKALWLWLEEQARAAGYKQVFLAVDPNNERAIPLFIGLGYAPTGNHLMIDNPDSHQVNDPGQVSSYYAIYQKSLLAH